MAPHRVTFILPFYNNKSDGDFYLSNFKDEPDLEEEAKLALKEDIILLKDNNKAFNSDFKPEEDTSFVNIEKFLKELDLINPPPLPPAKIPKLPYNLPPSAPPKAKGYVILLTDVIRAWLSYRDVGVRQEHRELYERGFSKLQSSVF
jgi:hypothetical protein